MLMQEALEVSVPELLVNVEFAHYFLVGADLLAQQELETLQLRCQRVQLLLLGGKLDRAGGLLAVAISEVLLAVSNGKGGRPLRFFFLTKLNNS